MKKKNKPLVSIIMNCYNGERFLSKSIKSIILQSYKNWELIFFDNLSTDKSKDIVKSFKDKRIKYFYSKKFLKLYFARNLAINKARGKYISFCDTDDWWKRNKLKKQVSLMERKNYNLTFSNIFMYNNKTKTSKLFFHSKIPNGKMTQFLLDDYKLGILTVMLKRKIFKKRKFNKKYDIIGDFDFFLKLSLKENFFCDPTPLAYHRKHEKNFSKKIDLYLNELEDWSKKNLSKLSNLGYSLFRFRFFMYKIKLKQLIGWGV